MNYGMSRMHVGILCQLTVQLTVTEVKLAATTLVRVGAVGTEKKLICNYACKINLITIW